MRNKNAMQIGKWVVAAALAVPCGSVMAATIASDIASNAAYNDPAFFTNGTNGGSGFTPWTINNGGGGTFIGTSNVVNFTGQGNIDTDGESFGLFAEGASPTTASRGFTGGDLSVGQSFLISIDNGGVDLGRRVGFALTGAGGNRFEFSFLGGGAFYQVIGSSTTNTSQGFSTRGLQTTFTLTGANTYDFQVVSTQNPSGNSFTENFSGTLGGTTGNGLTGFSVFNNNNAQGGNNDFFVNSVAVIPEPTSLAALAIGALTLLRRRQA